MNPNSWRLILDPLLDGPTNMAIDEAILESVGRDAVAPTLRLYRWQTPCLSLGYGQPGSDADLERIANHNWEIVRRMTGGRAILHTDELTYSVCLPENHPLAAGTIVESYRRLSNALLEALKILGLQAGADRKAEGTKTNGAICFEVPSDYEITADGKKLLGSAQVRKLNAVLQHGSLPLYGDITRICEALVFRSEAERQTAKARVGARAACFADVAGFTIDWDQAAQAMTDAFTSVFDLSLQPVSLTDEESARAEELRQTRYAHPDWTFKR